MSLVFCQQDLDVKATPTCFMVALSFVMLNQSAFMLKTSLHWVWVKLSTPNLTLRTGYGNKLNSPSNITTVVTGFLPHYFENQVRSTSNSIFQWHMDQTTKCRSLASHSKNHVLGLIIYDTHCISLEQRQI